MSDREAFDQILARVCGEQGWKEGESEFELDVALADGRRQKVQLEFFEHEGSEMLRLHTTIGSTLRIRQDRLAFALELNFALPHGSMAVKDDMLVMVDTLILSEADPLEVRATIAYLAETADRYEASMFGSDTH